MRRLVAALALAAAVTGAAGCATSARPEGVLERWLQAVSDLGRAGLAADAQDRLATHGDPALAPPLVPAEPEEDERHFEGIEVGRAHRVEGQADVPFRITRRLAGGDTDELERTAVLTRDGESWRVTAIRDRQPGEEVPSEGGAQPAGASLGQWLFALALAGLFGVTAVVLVERAARHERASTTSEP